MPVVTIGMPAYNSERFIGMAIKSILQQTFKDFELIITDDGSTDRTVEIAKSFNDPRITVVQDGENHGISYRLNQQIDLAKGKYFARMDSDDIMLPDRLENQVKYLEDHPDVDLIGGGAIIIDAYNNILGQRIKNECVQVTTDAWYNGTVFVHPTVTGKISFFKNHKYSEDLKGVEDADLWFRGSLDSKMIYLPFPVLLYREPLVLRYKTYLFRYSQSRNLWRSPLMRSHFNLNKRLTKITKSYLKTLIVLLVKLFKLDRVYISKHNTSLTVSANLLSKIGEFTKLLQS